MHVILNFNNITSHIVAVYLYAILAINTVINDAINIFPILSINVRVHISLKYLCDKTDSKIEDNVMEILVAKASPCMPQNCINTKLRTIFNITVNIPLIIGTFELW